MNEQKKLKTMKKPTEQSFPPLNISTSQLSIQPDSMLEISPPNSAVLANEQAIWPLKPEDAKVVHNLLLYNRLGAFCPYPH